MTEWLARYRGYILITLLNLIVSGAAFVFLNQPAPRPIQIDPVTPLPEPTPTPARIVVYVNGAVRTPGVHALADGARVTDAVEAAGGPTADADLARVNLAQRLRDEEQVYVPHVGETDLPVVQTGATGASGGGKVNVNTATVVELQTLPGIGPSLAQRIVDYRTAHGAFARVEDVKKVSGIGDKLFERIKDQITV